MSIEHPLSMQPHPGNQFATLGGGCFWCLEAVYEEVQGVVDVESGTRAVRLPGRLMPLCARAPRVTPKWYASSSTHSRFRIASYSRSSSRFTIRPR